MRIYLIGYMASGKSTVGRELAKMLRCSFVDLDEFIEDQFGKTIADIFAEHGEDFFRHCESEALRDVALLHDSCVIATGGGASCYYGNIDFMNADGTTVYLRLEVATLVSRLINDKTRPLVRDKSPYDLNNYILSALNLRRKFYEKAQIVLDVDGCTPVEITETIMSILV